MYDRRLYLFKLTSDAIHDVLVAAWIAGSVGHIPAGSTLRTWQGAGQHWAALEIVGDGSGQPFDGHIPSGATHSLIESRPLETGEDPYIPVDLAAVALGQLGNRPAVPFGGA